MDTVTNMSGQHASLTASDIQQLYIAYFGRPADSEGLKFWIDVADRLGMDLKTMSSYFQADQESQSLYGNKANAALVDSVYNHVLGRAADAEGRAFWIAALEENKISQSDFVFTIIDVVSQQPYSSEYKLIEQRKIAANSLTDLLTANSRDKDYTGAAHDAAREWIAGIGADSDDLTSALQVVSRLVKSFSDGRVTGVVFDGYIADAEVFIDVDGNGQLDAGEPVTKTDESGNFSFPIGTTKGVVVATGGTDIATGLPWVGTLKAPVGALTITPITNLAQSLIEKGLATNVEKAENLIFSSFPELPRFDLSVYDPTLFALNGTDTQKAESVAIQSVTAQIVNILSTGAALLEGAGVTSEAAQSAVLQSLISKVGAAQPLDLTKAEEIGAVFQSAVSIASSDAEVVGKVGELLTSVTSIVSEVNTRAQVAAEAFIDGRIASSVDALSDIAKLQTLTNGELSNDIKQAASSGNTTDLEENYTGESLTSALDKTQAGNLTPDTPTTIGTDVTNGGDTGGGTGGGGGSGGNSGGDTTKPMASEFTSTVTTVGATSSEAGTLGLYVGDTLLSKVGGTLSTTMAANTAATIAVNRPGFAGGPNP